MYQECLDANLVMTTVKSTGACSKACDGGTRTDVYNTKDKTSGNACSKTLNKTGVACNTMGCCSATNTTYSAWSGWGACSAACGNSGTQSRTRTKYIKSNYSGQICSQSTETATQACNRVDCCSSKRISSYGGWYDSGSCSKSCGGGTLRTARTRYYVSNYNGQSCGSDTEYSSRSCNTQTCAPAQPSVYNPTGGGWTKNNFSLQVSTSTPSSGVGYWYWSYDNWNWNVYSDSYGKTSYTTSAYSAERNQLSYTRVCNRSASGPNDSANCSPSTATWIRIDKTAPSYSVIPKNETWQGAPRYLLIQYSDSGCGLGNRYLSNTAGAQNVTYPTVSFNGAGSASDGLASAWWSMPWALTICDTLGNCRSGSGTAKW